MGKLEGDSPRRIAVFRALQLGDMLCAVPALRALRAAFPDAHITLIGLPWARTFAARFHAYVDDFIEFPGFPGLPECRTDVASWPEFLATTQRCRFDLAIQLHGNGHVVNPIVVLFGAARNAGCYLPADFCPDPAYFMIWPEDEPEIWRYLRLLEFLGIPQQGASLEFPLDESDYLALHRDSAGEWLLPKEYICIHPGARMPSRRWPAERFAVVADYLTSRGWRIVLTSAADEANITASVREHMRAPALDLTGRTSLGSLAALIEKAGMVICNDTGISHVAAAVGTPSIVICSGSDPRRWAPLDKERHRVLFEPISCRPCMHLTCPIGHLCALAITPEMVIKEIDAHIAYLT